VELTDKPAPGFFELLQAFRMTITDDRMALELWHFPCGQQVGDALPLGVGLGLTFETARAHVCINRP
jgi:hypothetical protein